MKKRKPNLTINRETIDITPFREPDPDWIFIDKSGHKFRYSNVEIHEHKYLKVKGVKWIIDYPGDDEYPEEGHYECIKCGDTVEPDYRPVVYRQYMPGLTEYLVDDEPVTKEEFEKVCKKYYPKLWKS